MAYQGPDNHRAGPYGDDHELHDVPSGSVSTSDGLDISKIF